jgi:hypothetical protein
MNRSLVRPAFRLAAALLLIGFVGAAPVFANENDRDDTNTPDSAEELVAPGAVRRPVRRTRPGETAVQPPVVVAPQPAPVPVPAPVVVAPRPAPAPPVAVLPDDEIITGIRPVRPVIEADETREILLTRREITRALYRQGYEAIAPIRRRGAVYITEAIGPNGERVRLVVDAFTGDIEGRRVLAPRRITYSFQPRRWAGWEIGE